MSLLVRGRAELFFRPDEVLIVAHRVVGEVVQQRMTLGRHFRRIAGDEPPQHRLVVRVADAGQVQQQGKGEGAVVRRWRAVVDVPGRVLQLRIRFLFRELVQESQVLVDAFRNDVEVEPLRPPRLLIHEK